MATPTPTTPTTTPEHPPYSPEISNLEIQGTLAGTYSQSADLKITVQVQCLPDTTLQLLHLYPACKSLISTSLAPLTLDNGAPGEADSGSLPVSPLFDFSTPGSGSSNDTAILMRDQGVPGANTGSSEGILDESSSARAGDDAPGASQQDGGVLSSRSAESCPPLNKNKCGEAVRARRSGKRTAQDACFTDSETEAEGDLVKDNGKGKGKIISTAQSVKNGLSPGDIPQIQKINHGSGSESGSRVGEFVEAQDMKRLRSQSSPEKPSGRKSLLPKLSVGKNKMGKRSTSDPECPVSELDFAATIEVEESIIDEGEGLGHGVEQTTGPRSSRSQKIPLNETPTDEEVLGHLYSQSLSSLEATLEAAKESPVSSKVMELEPSHTEQSYHSNSNGSPSLQPHLKAENGILFLKCSSSVQPATYKITINVSVDLEDTNSNGWSALKLSGLPKMQPGDSGTLLFLIPEEHGIEFRTKSLQRYKIVENCFFAEFVSSDSLTVPMRLCDAEFYGFLKDFSLDQEIRAEYLLEPPAAADELSQTITIKYSAMCSLRLRDHCIFSKGCGVTLYMDGGPKGSFSFFLGFPNDGYHHVQIPTTEGCSTGISRIQLGFSPKEELDAFCLTWSIKMPIQQAMNWLPRILSESSSASDQDAHRLRHILTGTAEETVNTVVPYEDFEAGDSEAENESNGSITFSEVFNEMAKQAEHEDEEVLNPSQMNRISHTIKHIDQQSDIQSHSSKDLIFGCVLEKRAEECPVTKAIQCVAWKDFPKIALIVSYAFLGSLFILGAVLFYGAYIELLICPRADLSLRTIARIGKEGRMFDHPHPSQWCNFAQKVIHINGVSKKDTCRWNLDMDLAMNEQEKTDVVEDDDSEADGASPDDGEVTTGVAIGDLKVDAGVGPDPDTPGVKRSLLFLRDKIDCFLGWKGPICDE